VLAAGALRDVNDLPGQRPGDPAVLRAVETVARHLGNTRTVCRRCYVHPAVIDAYLDGSLAAALEQRVRQRLGGPRAPRRLETAVLALLERRLRRQAARPAMRSALQRRPNAATTSTTGRQVRRRAGGPG
jgi:DNA topoisomerase-1